ncbi:PREDICTED: probable calcium-binding protein CML45 [Nicotiana attenuata]|uniref:Calcium-binding protein cml45 n=1 Tax=Nicotiana attenuata TaxID=49451 RepID=A0A1J6IN78_NICAT|nr:PREDICTED: probable calcium-binding protein CML45 [Nicotiana attenuata]OIT06146.1 putative calcium-binding protein cml45 [Nicotiana attenuata]
MAAPSYLNRFTFKKLPLTTVPVPLLIHGLVGFFLLYIIFDWGRKFINFLSQTQNSKKSKVGPSDHLEKNKKTTPFMLVDGSLCREEVEIIMAKLGFFCHPEGEKLQERFDLDNLYDLFGEEEYNMQYLGEAFDVFDENKDGFIDETELQRVLYALGLKHAAELENCRKMILAFDEDGDGKIDFEEFVNMI